MGKNISVNGRQYNSITKLKVQKNISTESYHVYDSYYSDDLFENTKLVAPSLEVQTINPSGDNVALSQVVVQSIGAENLIPEYIQAGKTISIKSNGLDDNPDSYLMSVTGTYTNDATATANDILVGKTAYIKGEKVVGARLTSGGIIPEGIAYITTTAPTNVYNFAVAKVDSEFLRPENIKQGIEILGKVGTYGGIDTTTAIDFSAVHLGYFYNDAFYTDKAHVHLIEPVDGNTYMDKVSANAYDYINNRYTITTSWVVNVDPAQLD